MNAIVINKPDDGIVICFLHLDVKGFWQADIYLDGESIGESPDEIITIDTGYDMHDLIDKVKTYYSDPVFVKCDVHEGKVVRPCLQIV